MLTTVSSSMLMTATLYEPNTESFTTCLQVNVDSSLTKPLEM